jgi:predicted TPR repeat methyltransferase
MRSWDLFDATSNVLDVGCGIGRCLERIAPLVHSISGIDVSEAMLRIAAQRTARFKNVRVVHGSGRDLSAFRDRRFHLIVAVDSFPYLVKARVADRHFGDCAGLLDEGGHLLIFNYSYQGNLEADRASVRRAARRHGFSLLRDGTRDLEHWDGAAYLMQKRHARPATAAVM